MKLILNYSKATYGNPGSASCYTVKLSTDLRSVSIVIKYEDSENDVANVTGGEISLPRNVATKLAAAILWAYEQDKTGPRPITFKINEKDIENEAIPAVPLIDVALGLDITMDEAMDMIPYGQDFSNPYHSIIRLSDALRIESDLEKKKRKPKPVK